MSAAKEARRAVRLEARRKTYTHLPPRAERDKVERKKRSRAIFVPLPGRTIFDRMMGSEVRHVGGISQHAPSTHSKKRKRPAVMARKAARRRKVVRRERAYADVIVNADLCAHGQHDLRTVTLADGRTYRHCVRYRCGMVTTPR